MRVILDTGLFFQPEKLRQLRDDDCDVIVPAVVYQERLRQLRRRGSDEGDLARLLAYLQFDVEAFSVTEAHRRIVRVGQLSDAQWTRLARDAVIAGHVRPDDQLWTTNGKDFVELGVPAEQVVHVPAP